MPYLAKYAFVVWPDAYDKTLPCCITAGSVEMAVKGGAVVIAREWDIDAQLIDVWEPRQSNPRRHLDEADGA